MTPRYNRNPPSVDIDVDSAKERFRAALRSASIAESVREHPWGSVVGTFAGAFTLAALLGDDSNNSPKPRASQLKAHLVDSHTSAGVMQWLFGLGVKLALAYLGKSALKTAAAESDPTQEGLDAVE